MFPGVDCRGVPGEGTRSELYVNFSPGYGSSAGAIRYYTQIQLQAGGAIKYVPSSVFGDTFVIQESGLYSINIADYGGSTVSRFGITVNVSSALFGIDPSNITYAQGRRALTISTNTSFVHDLQWVGYLRAGDQVRSHQNGAGVVNDPNSSFYIAKIK